MTESHNIKHWSEFSLTEEQIKRYQAMPIEKRLEWLYLGNQLRKAFCDAMDAFPAKLNTGKG